MVSRGIVKKQKKGQVGRDRKKAVAVDPRSNRIVVACAFLIVVVILVGLEMVARSPAIAKAITVHSYGFQQFFFEIKWQKFNEFYQRYGKVEFVFFGNSMVNTGIDIDAFDVYLHKVTGEYPRSFNFGLDGLKLDATSDVIRLLVENFSLKVVVIGTELRDFATADEDTETDVFTGTPWLIYRLGGFSPYGWIVDHSAFLQIFLRYRNWAQEDFPAQYALIRHHWLLATETGYKGDSNKVVWSVPQPDFADPVEQARREQYQDFRFSEEKFTMLRELIEFCQEHGLMVILLEMPVTDEFYQYFPNPRGDRDEYLTRVKEVAAEAGALFVDSPALSVITPEGWSNLNHMNYIGANFYGQYLARLFSVDSSVMESIGIEGGP